MTRAGWGDLDPGYQPGDAGEYSAVPQEGRVVKVTSAGAEVTLSAGPAHTWGPAPWSLGSHSTRAAAITAGHYPHVGDRVLVIFAGDDHIPWIAAWWR